MKKKIQELCESIEEEKKVKILFAVENGSRAWRMYSEDSDYDVRFVFVRPLEDYIQINPPGDVIETAFDKEGNKVPVQGALIDISGFDIFKYLRLLSNSNPTTIEWLFTDIVYYGEQNLVFKKYAENNFNPVALYHRYKSMCRSNYLKYLKTGNNVTYKKYLYSYRGLINAKWVSHKKTIPPIVFKKAIKGMNNILPDTIIKKIEKIIALKSKGKEKDKVDKIVEMDNYIEKFLKDKSEEPKHKSHATFNELNEELRRILINR